MGWNRATKKPKNCPFRGFQGPVSPPNIIFEKYFSVLLYSTGPPKNLPTLVGPFFNILWQFYQNLRFSHKNICILLSKSGQLENKLVPPSNIDLEKKFLYFWNQWTKLHNCVKSHREILQNVFFSRANASGRVY